MALCRWPFLLLFASCATLPSAYAQIGSGAGITSYSFSYSDSIRGVKGMPYSAEFVSTTVRTLADGTHITEEQKRFEARDSEGRTRNEIYFPDNLAKLRNQPADQPTFITIIDPVKGENIHLNPQQKTAMVNVIPVHADRSPQSIVTSQAVRPPVPVPIAHSSQEKIGGRTIDGVYAEGTRTTRIYPAGTQGNDREITVVTERWFSPDLRLEVLLKTSDPRNGESTTELHNLSRAEPDPSLFQVPADYKIQSRPDANK